MSLVDALMDSSRPVFLFGSTPPREGTSIEKAKESCAKFAARSAVLAIDGFIVYDIQDEGGRTNLDRPFPFRKTMDPSLYASFFPAFSAKQCVVYKCVVEESVQAFQDWLRKAVEEDNHYAFNLVGPASSSVEYKGPTLHTAADLVVERDDCRFGCVAIPERHTKKGNEDENMLRKVKFGADWFITQGIFNPGPLIEMLNNYGDKCRAQGIIPKKVVLTFAPCGRQKTMTFIKWLGMAVPAEVEERIFSAESPVKESIKILCEILATVLQETHGSGVPIGINVESLSIFKEEIDAAHELFQKLQAILLNSAGSPWSVRWYFVDSPLRRVESRNSSPRSFRNSLSRESLSNMLSTNGSRDRLADAAVAEGSSVPRLVSPAVIQEKLKAAKDNSAGRDGSRDVSTASTVNITAFNVSSILLASCALVIGFSIGRTGSK